MKDGRSGVAIVILLRETSNSKDYAAWRAQPFLLPAAAVGGAPCNKERNGPAHATAPTAAEAWGRTRLSLRSQVSIEEQSDGRSGVNREPGDTRVNAPKTLLATMSVSSMGAQCAYPFGGRSEAAKHLAHISCDLGR